jgi:hypothetical protein
VYFCYALLLLHEITSSDNPDVQQENGSQASELLLKAITSPATLQEFLNEAVQQHRRFKERDKKDALKNANDPPLLKFFVSENDEQPLLMANLWESVFDEKNEANDARKGMKMAMHMIGAGAASEMSSLIGAERLSWMMMMMAVSGGGRVSIIVTHGNLLRWCVQKMVAETMSPGNVNAMLLVDGEAEAAEDDAFLSSVAGTSSSSSSSATHYNMQMKPAPLGADTFARSLTSRGSIEDAFFNKDDPKEDIDKGIIVIAVTNDADATTAAKKLPPFCVQYGIHFMCIHARSADWMARLRLDAGQQSIFHPKRINQMSASTVMALARVDCPLPSSFLDMKKSSDRKVIDATTELQLKNISMQYDIMPYVVWKAVLCRPDAPPQKTNALFDPRQVMMTGTDDNNDPLLLRFEDEWLNLRLEKNVSHDLFLAIRKLLVVDGKYSPDSGSKVGFFVMMKLSSSDKEEEEEWDDGIIVCEVKAKKIGGGVGRRGTRSEAVDVVYYEALYRSGRVAWHEDGVDMDDSSGGEQKTMVVHSFRDFGEYLKACHMSLKQWAGQFQHGKGTASEDADDSFIEGWMGYYDRPDS